MALGCGSGKKRLPSLPLWALRGTMSRHGSDSERLCCVSATHLSPLSSVWRRGRGAVWTRARPKASGRRVAGVRSTLNSSCFIPARLFRLWRQGVLGSVSLPRLIDPPYNRRAMSLLHRAVQTGHAILRFRTLWCAEPEIGFTSIYIRIVLWDLIWYQSYQSAHLLKFSILWRSSGLMDSLWSQRLLPLDTYPSNA